MMMRLSSACAGSAAPAASSAVPPSRRRRERAKRSSMRSLLWFLVLLDEDEAGRCGPADMNLLSHLGREAALPVGDLHYQPVGGREPHMDVDQRPEIGDEFHRARQPVVESGGGRCGDFDPLGPESQHAAAFVLAVEDA